MCAKIIFFDEIGILASLYSVNSLKYSWIITGVPLKHCRKFFRTVYTRDDIL